MDTNIAIVLLAIDGAVALGLGFWIIRRFWPPKEETPWVDETTLESMRRLRMTRIP